MDREVQGLLFGSTLDRSDRDGREGSDRPNDGRSSSVRRANCPWRVTLLAGAGCASAVSARVNRCRGGRGGSLRMAMRVLAGAMVRLCVMMGVGEGVLARSPRELCRTGIGSTSS